MDPIEVVGALVQRTVAELFGVDGVDPQIARSAHADLQCNVALGLARSQKRPPRELAEALAARLVGEVVERAEVAGAGFVNLVLRADWLGRAIDAVAADPRAGVPLASAPDRVVIDYSSPNVAKEMHVGHLRSTDIGDCIARVLVWRGHAVVRENHLGDWGLPFGMLIEHRVDTGTTALGIGELTAFYRAARRRYDDEPGFRERAQRRVVLLQSGDAQTRAWWRELFDLSLGYVDAVYRTLGVSLTRADIRAESAYNDELAPLADELLADGRAVIDRDTLCLFVPGFVNKQKEPFPLRLRNPDGAYGYAATDLAAIRHRLRDCGATRLIYVVGAPQTQHLAMVFAAAEALGWRPPGVRVEHVAFGSVLGSDGKMLKTREGQSVRLVDVIAEAVGCAEQRLDALAAERAARNQPAPALSAEQRAAVARAVGIGAIKYADLSILRLKDYVYDPARMIAFTGDTAGYLQYTHARIGGIFRRAGDVAPGAVEIGDPSERALALQLLGFAGVVADVERDCKPHVLAGYLFELATAFTKFYDACPILGSPSRLALAGTTQRVLARGLDLLGIEAPDAM